MASTAMVSDLNVVDSKATGRAPVVIDVTHELSVTGESTPSVKHLVVPPSDEPTVVEFRSRVAPLPSGIRSAAYIATVRRRKAATLAKQIEELRVHSDATDFHCYTARVFDSINQLIRTLSDNETTEGNACEMLRQIRDTFWDRGFQRFRTPDFRTEIRQLLDDIASADYVESEDAEDCRRRIRAFGATPVPPVDLTLEEDDDKEFEETEEKAQLD